MSDSFLAEVLCRELEGRQDQVYVALPKGLQRDAEALVAALQETASPNGAIFVTNFAPQTSGLTTCRWSEILRWRTEDPRIFVWIRRTGQTDSSMQSVVRPYIGEDFPIADNSLSSIRQLIDSAVHILFEQAGWPLGDAASLGFREAWVWCAQVTMANFRQLGNTSAGRWQDNWLVFWAAALNEVRDAVREASARGTLFEGRFSWDLLRVHGIPLPSEVSGGNPFVAEPNLAKLPTPNRFASRFQKLVSRYWLDDSWNTLYWKEVGAVTADWGGANTWSVLPGLANADQTSEDTPAVAIAAAAFASAPSLMSKREVRFPSDAQGAWNGVGEHQLNQARDRLEHGAPPRLMASEMLLPLGTAGDGPFVALTRNWQIQTKLAGKSAQWILAGELDLQLAAPIAGLSFGLPGTPIDGAVAIESIRDVSVLVTPRSGVRVTVTDAATELGFIRVKAHAEVTVRARRNSTADPYRAKWNQMRRLRLEIQTYSFSGGWRRGPRIVSSAASLVVPPPFAISMLAVQDGKVAGLSPGSSEIVLVHQNEAPSQWRGSTTSEVHLKKPDSFDVHIYDGRSGFSALGVVPPLWKATIDGRPVDGADHGAFTAAGARLQEGSTISVVESNGAERQIAVIRCEADYEGVSSGLAAALTGLPFASEPPPPDAEQSLLGLIQTRLVEGLLARDDEVVPGLGQVVFAVDADNDWTAPPNAEGLVCVATLASPKLPGLGSGPSKALRDSEAFHAFVGAADRIGDSVLAQVEHGWLPSVDPSNFTDDEVSTYLEAFTALIGAAVRLGGTDTFWARYPFSALGIATAHGQDYGTIGCILLSPLHPIRLAWAANLAKIARHSDISPATQNLLALAQGWNIPAVGVALDPLGLPVDFIAVPLDAGAKLDFLGWAALAPTSHSGMILSSPGPAQHRIPWSGQSGINDRVVDEALRAFLRLNPGRTSLVVDLRATAEVGRSEDIDRAVISVLGDRDALDIGAVIGGARVLDSELRLGRAPSRETLNSAATGEQSAAFEWHVYNPNNPPLESDVAFVENASVSIKPLNVSFAPPAVLAPGGLRRFAVARVTPEALEEGLTLLAQGPTPDLEYAINAFESATTDSGSRLMRSAATLHGLGLGAKSEWEILGTFHLDPALLNQSFLAASSDDKVLWEWRPAWLVRAEGINRFGRRPYYVLGRLPRSLRLGLEKTLGFDSQQTAQLVQTLGSRGIGVNSIMASSGTNASSAAGFFYGLKLVSALGFGGGMPAQDAGAPQLAAVMALDPIAPLLEDLAGRTTDRRADMLMFLGYVSDGSVRVRMVPIELKHHGTLATSSQVPVSTDQELLRARKQLAETSSLLVDGVKQAVATGGNGAALRRLGFATIFETAAQLSGSDADASGAVLAAIVAGTATIEVGTSVLLWFANGSAERPEDALSTQPVTVGDSVVIECYCDPGPLHSLWWADLVPGLAAPGLQALRHGISVRPPVFSAELSPQPLVARDPLRVEHDVLGRAAHAGDAGPSTEPPAVPPLPKEFGPEQHAEPLGGPTSQEVPSQAPLMIGARDTTRWTIVGALEGADRSVALDLDQPQGIGVFGYMGSGKSYLLGGLIESAVTQLPGLNMLPSPLAVVVFNYRRNARDRFELSSLLDPNADIAAQTRLASGWGATVASISGMDVLALPGTLSAERLEEYGRADAHELYFKGSTLGAEDWELLMGQPETSRLYAQTIRAALLELSTQPAISVEEIEEMISSLPKSSRGAAEARLSLAGRYINDDKGIDFGRVVRPGRVTVVDLRQAMFDKEDALRFFLICANQISKLQGSFNKLIIFDEAHEYMSAAFGEKIESRLLYMRHEGATYVFATQSVEAIPDEVRRWIGTKFVFGLGTDQNITDLEKFAPELKGHARVNLEPGECLVQSNVSESGAFQSPRLIRIRPRVTAHGGATRVYR